MRQYLIILIQLVSACSYAQFAIVCDNDGFVNVREDGQSNSKIIDTLKNGHLVYCFEKNGNWTSIENSRRTKECNGYIYNDKNKLISQLPSIPIVSKTQNAVRLKK